MGTLEKYQGFKAELAIAETFEELKFIESKAAAAAEFAKKNKIGLNEQNQWGIFRVEIEDKKGEWLDKMFPANLGKKIIGLPNATLKSEGISKKESTNARLVHNEPVLKEKTINEIIATGKVITPNLVSTIMRKEKKRKEILKNNEEILKQEIIQPTGLYDVIVIDPAWQMKKIERDVAPEQVEFDYPTMTDEEILNIEIPASENCHIFLWTTQKHLPFAFECLKKWNVNYIFTMVWHKNGGFQPFGLPQYNCEFCLYGRIGTPQFIDLKKFNTCFSADRTRHSEKPQYFYDLLNRVTIGRRLDMFARRKIKGFDNYGNEAK